MFTIVRFVSHFEVACVAIRLRYRVRKSQKTYKLIVWYNCFPNVRGQSCVSSTSKDLVSKKIIGQIMVE